MKTGLYGKLPAKRDFIALSATRDFLLVWEAWVQGGVSASMLRLGEGWRSAYLTAPIWRFWLGAEICGETILGAFMPSLDGVGRYHPLTVFVRAGEGGSLPPPEFEPQTQWFKEAEEFLLATLEDGAGFEPTAMALDRLPLPVDRVPPFARREAIALTDGSKLIEAGPTSFADVFASARMADHAAAYAASTFWWTAGGEGFPAMALAKRRMPDPFVFSGMLTGDFNSLLD
jgi:type VI secretion system protein ImpM